MDQEKNPSADPMAGTEMAGKKLAAATGDEVVAAGKKLLENKVEEAIARTAAKAIRQAVAGDVAFTDNLRPNSVELAVNAKGGVQPTVKVYHDDPKEAAKIALETLGFVKEQLGDRLAK